MVSNNFHWSNELLASDWKQEGCFKKGGGGKPAWGSGDHSGKHYADSRQTAVGAEGKQGY
jgi:hypothetical protein